MTRLDAEHLLGGYATGTLTAAERQVLLAAALDRQDLFDALMDEEALRELLADPLAKAQLLAALAPTAAPKVVPLWRRPGILGAAAGLLVASLAGLAVLRSPQPVPTSAHQVLEAGPAPKVAAVPLEQAPQAQAETPVPAAKAKAAAPPAKAAPPVVGRAPSFSGGRLAPASPGVAAGMAALAPVEKAREAIADAQVAQAQDRLARKAEAPRAAAMLGGVAASVAQDKQDRSRNQASQLAPAGAVVGGLVGGAVAPATAESTPARRVEGKALPPTPTWVLQRQPGGLTRIQVRGATGAQALLLRRQGAGVEVVPLHQVEAGQGWTRWSTDLRLAADDRLDLYLLNVPVADPAQLSETGPVDGFRARIHPVLQKDPTR